MWAGGEFHDPKPAHLRGDGLADHSSSPAAWQPHEGELVVIGGYESGIDVACHHVAAGASVTVVDADTPWDAQVGCDPSFRLAPRSRQRLRAAQATGRLRLLPVRAVGIKRDGDGHLVRLSDGSAVRSQSRPIAATGFGAGLGPVADLFARRTDGLPELDDDDQSTITPGLFLSGPTLRHGRLKFCFIYKFRQRFAHIAQVIGDRAGKDTSGLEAWREAGMLTDDLACCGTECRC